MGLRERNPRKKLGVLVLERGDSLRPQGEAKGEEKFQFLSTQGKVGFFLVNPKFLSQIFV